MLGVRVVQVAAAVLVVAVLVVVANRPALLLWTLGGVVVGATLGALAAWLPTTAARFDFTDEWKRLDALYSYCGRASRKGFGIPLLVALLAGALVGGYFLSRLEPLSLYAPPLQDGKYARTDPRLKPLETLSAMGSRAPGRVSPMRYTGVFRYVSAEDAWRGREIVRISRTELDRLASPIGRAPPNDLLGSTWRLEGRRGKHGTTFLFVQRRTIHTPEPGWLGWPVKSSTVAVPVVEAPGLEAVLVPRDGSTIEFRSPRNLIRNTDPKSEVREFGNEVIVAVALTGLEDDPDRREVSLEIANVIGRSTAYGVVDAISAWKVLIAIFGGVPLVVVGYFVNRFLKRRWP
jgi:hypothetical protein